MARISDLKDKRVTKDGTILNPVESTEVSNKYSATTFENFWNQIKIITEQLNDDGYHAEWKDNIIKNHKPSFAKEVYEKEENKCIQ